MYRGPGNDTCADTGTPVYKGFTNLNLSAL